MRRAVLSRFRSAPGVSAIVLLLLGTMVLFWRPDRHRVREVVKLVSLQARLNDGVHCEFSADIELASRWGRVAFGMRENTVRSMLIGIVRSKSRYMVNNTTSRESLRHEMLVAVNGLIGAGNATAVSLPQFELL
jgi:hypothetical protein